MNNFYKTLLFAGIALNLTEVAQAGALRQLTRPTQALATIVMRQGSSFSAPELAGYFGTIEGAITQPTSLLPEPQFPYQIVYWNDAKDYRSITDFSGAEFITMLHSNDTKSSVMKKNGITTTKRFDQTGTMTNHTQCQHVTHPNGISHSIVHDFLNNTDSTHIYFNNTNLSEFKYVDGNTRSTYFTDAQHNRTEITYDATGNITGHTIEKRINDGTMHSIEYDVVTKKVREWHQNADGKFNFIDRDATGNIINQSQE